jgi:hypothetical protein
VVDQSEALVSVLIVMSVGVIEDDPVVVETVSPSAVTVPSTFKDVLNCPVVPVIAPALDPPMVTPSMVPPLMSTVDREGIVIVLELRSRVAARSSALTIPSLMSAEVRGARAASRPITAIR